MLLDRIDIDAHGPLQRVELGPFAEHLNVVCGPEGSGKTAIARFVRDSLVSREYPLGMLSSSTGRVVWADRNGMVHCRREQDGTHQGRRTIEFESRGELDRPYGALDNSWLSGVGASSDSGRAVRSLQLPESIVDGVITDTAVTSVARVVSACVRSGLDSHETYRSLPISEHSIYQNRDGYAESVDGLGPRSDRNRRLREELAGIEAELSRFGDLGADHQDLLDRRSRLTARLAHRSTTHSPSRNYDRSHHGQWQKRLTELHDRARRLRARQSELRRWIAEIDRDIARSATRYSAVPGSDEYQYDAAVSDDDLRRQLDDLDAQMIRWRRTLLEVRGLRQTLVSSDSAFAAHSMSPLDESSLRRMRLDGFLHAIDRYTSPIGKAGRSKNWDDMYPEAYRPLHHIDDIGHRIDSATRQIDWLLERYAGPEKPQVAWYETLPDSVSYRSASTLGDALRAIREDLRHVQLQTSHAPLYRSYAATGELEELRLSEQWFVAAIDRLNRHRESLLHSHTAAGNAEVTHWSRDNRHDRYVLGRERSSSIAQLDRVTSDLDDCLSEAADARHSMPITNADFDDEAYGLTDRDALVAELRRIDDRLASGSRFRSLQSRRAQLREQLSVVRRDVGIGPVDTKSPLADAASRWLIRLSAGRLQRIQWPLNHFRTDRNSYHRSSYHRTGVTINRRDESECSAADRAVAVMAVRLAAGDLLAGTGRHIPLVFETHREMLGNAQAARQSDLAALAYYEHGDHFHSNEPIAAALRDYAKSGRQVVVLTSDQNLTSQLSRAGARRFEIYAQRVVHAHRPLWRPHYNSETYVGPHPHTYGLRGADEVLGQQVTDDERYRAATSLNEYPRAATQRAATQRTATQRTATQRTATQPAATQRAPIVDINRDFDMAWREAYGYDDNPDGVMVTSTRTASPGAASARTDWARDGIECRDGYYFANTYTTVAPQQAFEETQGRSLSSTVAATATPERTVQAAAGRTRQTVENRPVSPFFLSVDSPIDQAPSIDAVAAARLRGLNVTHINHLMQQDSNRLADALGLVNVDASTIRRWQSECRLVCRVPQLRGFDSRVLVGCGVTTPAQLASIHPVDLLQEVEEFLATGRGQQILLSGSSHELSRITSWIAAGNSSSDPDFDAFGRNRHRASGGQQSGGQQGGPQRRRSYYRGFNQGHESEYAYDSDRYEYDRGEDAELLGHGATRRRRRRIIRTMNERDAAYNSGEAVRNQRDSEYDPDAEYGSRAGGYARSGNRSRGNGSRSNGSRRNGSRSNVSGNGRGSRNGLRTGVGNGTGRSNRSSRGNSGSGNGSSQPRSRSDNNGRGYGSGDGTGTTTGRVRRNRGRKARHETPDRNVVRYEQERDEREPQSTREPRERQEHDSERELRFYLHRDSPVVDAPSIGSRMSERLNSIGIYTVNDLLTADPETTATELDHRRVDADTIVLWQHQATMMCRVPMLRGHDAQLLIAAEVTTPEELAVSDAEELFGIVDPVARSSEGKRIIRGGKTPDLEEVADWIKFAQHQRAIQAA